MSSGDALFGQKIFSLGNLTHVLYFNERWSRLVKSVKEVSPIITISESKKSGQGRLIFSHNSHRKNFQFTMEQKID